MVAGGCVGVQPGDVDLTVERNRAARVEVGVIALVLTDIELQSVMREAVPGMSLWTSCTSAICRAPIGRGQAEKMLKSVSNNGVESIHIFPCPVTVLPKSQAFSFGCG